MSPTYISLCWLQKSLTKRKMLASEPVNGSLPSVMVSSAPSVGPSSSTPSMMSCVRDQQHQFPSNSDGAKERKERQMRRLTADMDDLRAKSVFFLQHIFPKLFSRLRFDRRQFFCFWGQGIFSPFHFQSCRNLSSPSLFFFISLFPDETIRTVSDPLLISQCDWRDHPSS